MVDSNNAAEPTSSKRPGRQLLALLVALIILAAGAGIVIYVNTSTRQGYNPGGGSGQNNTMQLTTAPDFTLIDTDGHAFTLGAKRGKVVVIDFGSINCVPCKQQALELKTVNANYASKGVEILTIDVNAADSVSDLAQFKLDRGGTWPFAIDTKGVYLMPEYSATLIPTIIIVDRAGYVAHRNVGLEYANELGAILDGMVR